jgi:hypothetical protein
MRLLLLLAAAAAALAAAGGAAAQEDGARRTSWGVVAMPGAVWPQYALRGVSGDGRYAVVIGCGAADDKYLEGLTVVGTGPGAWADIEKGNDVAVSTDAWLRGIFRVSSKHAEHRAAFAPVPPGKGDALAAAFAAARREVVATVGTARAYIGIDGLADAAALYRDGCRAAREDARGQGADEAR